MGVGRQDLAEPRVGRRRVRAKLSLYAGKARTPSGGRRAGAVTTVAMAALALWAPAYHSRFSQVTLRTASSSLRSGTGNGQLARWPGGAGAMLPGRAA